MNNPLAKYFPIKTESSCLHKWSWSSIQLTHNEVKSCCKVQGYPLTLENFDNFHNNIQNIEDRKLMLLGQWPKSHGCVEYCKSIEDSGGISERVKAFNISGMNPIEMSLESEPVFVTPTLIEIWFNNLCNLSCVYCNGMYSSKWEQETVKFGELIENNEILIQSVKQKNNKKELEDKFWLWLEKNYFHLKKLSVLGGEPFYQKQLDKIINFFDVHDHKDLELIIVSNCSISHTNFVYKIEKIKNLIKQRKIKKLTLSVSIESMDRQAEFVRYGMKINTWKKNIEYLLKQRWIQISFNHLLTVLTIKEFKEFCNYLDKQEILSNVHHKFQIIKDPKFLSPTILGNNYFDTDLNFIVKYFTNNKYSHCEIDQIKSLIDYIKFGKEDKNQIKKLFIFLNELDRRRNNNWRKVFPWLFELSKKYVV